MIEVLPSTCYPYRPRPVRQGLQAVAVHGGTQGFAKGNDVVLSSGAEMLTESQVIKGLCKLLISHDGIPSPISLKTIQNIP